MSLVAVVESSLLSFEGFLTFLSINIPYLSMVITTSVFLFDLVRYLYSSFSGDTSKFTSNGLDLIAKTMKDSNLHVDLKNFQSSGNPTDDMTRILRIIADAVEEYGDQKKPHKVNQLEWKNDL